MRVVRDQESLKEHFERATSEAKSAFGNGTVFVERFLDKPKHIEVQLLGDSEGNVVHLYERDCSVQRRHQKVVEIAPAKDLPVETRDAILADAVKLAKSVNYRNAGTAEFLVDQQNRYYFIEINPRIQVEHTITEEITGIDIVAAQIQIAAGATLAQLGLTQDRISTRGFAIQCRITTEDPSKGFSPDTGKLEVYRSAGGNGVRLDGGNGFAGAVITPYYDSMLVKCTCQGSTYEIARRKMLRALVEFRIRGVKTNIPFLASLLTHPTFIDGTCWTTFIDDTPQLFDLVGSQNRAQKLLSYLGDVAVNGSSIKGQMGEPKLKGEVLQPELLKADGTKLDCSQPCKMGWRQVLLDQGPKAFAKAVRDYKGCLLMDTTWRDAHQSLLATRVRTVDLLNIAHETSHALHNLYSLECWGGATFDVAFRFLYEDPWDRLRKMRKLVPNIPFQMLLRGANGVAYSSLPDNAIEHFVEHAKKNGVDIFRVFDALNDINQLEVGIKAVHKAGGVAEGTVCISGDLLVSFSFSFCSPFFPNGVSLARYSIAFPHDQAVTENSRRDAKKHSKEKLAETIRKSREKNLVQKKYFCNVCNVKFGSASQLRHHNTLRSHIDKAAGITRVVKCPRAKERGEENLFAQRYYCGLCDYAAKTRQKLNYHLLSKKDLNKVQDLES